MRQDKRERILDAALNVFSRKGVFVTRIGDVFIEAYHARPQVVELLLLEFTRMSKFLEPI